jgi:hypothetical protein
MQWSFHGHARPTPLRVGDGGGEVIRCHALRDYNNCTSSTFSFSFFHF